jgi:glutamyl-tRNA synthetase
VQVDILAALGAKTPALAHLPALQEGTGRRARRPEGLALRQLRADGMEPAALAAYLATLGTGLPATQASLADCDLGRFTAARFDIAALLAANRALLAATEHEAVAARLPPGATESFWLCVRKHIDLLPEARGWWDVVAGEIVPPEIDGESALLRLAIAALPPEPWSEQVWPEWRDGVAASAGRPAPEVAQILRLALTGEEHGPDMASLLPLIGRARAASRLEIAAC